MANVYPSSKSAEIDLTNAIGAKLAVFVVATDGAVKELVSDLPLSIGAGITVSASGLIVYDGTSNAIMSTELLSPLSDISFYTRVKYNVSTVDQAVFGINSTASYQLLTAWADTSGGKLRSRIWASAGGYGPSDGLPVNTWLNWGGKANAAANLATTFVSGLPTVIDSNIGSREWETENTIYIGSSGSIRPINGEKQYFAYFSEELTDAEFLSFNNDPWQVLKDGEAVESGTSIAENINNSSSVSNNEQISLIGEVVVLSAAAVTTSICNGDAVSLSAAAIISGQKTSSESIASQDQIKLSGEFLINDFKIDSASSANNDTVSLTSNVNVSELSSSTNAIANSDNVNFIGRFEINDKAVNSLSLLDVGSLSFLSEISILEGIANSNSKVNADFIQIGDFNFDVYSETNISAKTLSRNITASRLSTNISG